MAGNAKYVYIVIKPPLFTKTFSSLNYLLSVVYGALIAACAESWSLVSTIETTLVAELADRVILK